MSLNRDQGAKPELHSLSRKQAMDLFARSSLQELQACVDALASQATPAEVKPAESGMVMLRGRVGGDGAPFNLGEASVSRCVVELGGHRGFGFTLGRSQVRARLAAMLDALWQEPGNRGAITERLIVPVRARLEAERQHKASKAAATKVEFFTLVRGEVP
jgi:alpha-D-ribose 1-methylphosphonate 5-triphosphate synthase subunit PhnG